MSKITVAIIFGGESPEHEVSCASAANIISNMSLERYNIVPIYITKEGKWLLYDGHLDNIRNLNWDKYGTPAILSPDKTHKGVLRIVSDKVKVIPLDVIFPVLHGAYGEDGKIQGLFELSGIPYVGCGTDTSAICMDKAFAKAIVKGLKINQADYICLYSNGNEDFDEIKKLVRYKIGYPCFVKPANAGSSVGISKVKCKDELSDALKKAFLVDRKIIVEKCIVGREFECAVLKYEKSGTLASCVGEVLAADEFYTYDAKYNNKASQTIVPADLPEETAQEIRRSAVAIFDAVDGRGLSRVDFFVDEAGKIIFNEINTMPGFTAISLYPTLWEQEGIPVTDLLDKLIMSASI